MNLKRRIDALERARGVDGVDECVTFVVLYGHDLPAGCEQVLLDRDRKERPDARVRLIDATDADGRCVVCGRVHTGEPVRHPVVKSLGPGLSLDDV